MIELDFSHQPRSRVDVDSNCDNSAQIYLAKLKTLEQGLNVQPNGVISSSILAAANNNFQTQLRYSKNEKLSKYDEVVSIFNKALLAMTTLDVINEVSD